MRLENLRGLRLDLLGTLRHGLPALRHLLRLAGVVRSETLLQRLDGLYRSLRGSPGNLDFGIAHLELLGRLQLVAVVVFVAVFGFVLFGWYIVASVVGVFVGGFFAVVGVFGLDFGLLGLVRLVFGLVNLARVGLFAVVVKVGFHLGFNLGGLGAGFRYLVLALGFVGPASLAPGVGAPLQLGHSFTRAVEGLRRVELQFRRRSRCNAVDYVAHSATPTGYSVPSVVTTLSVAAFRITCAPASP